MQITQTERLILHKESCPLILIKDSIHQRYDELLNNLIDNASKSQFNITLVSFQQGQFKDYERSNIKSLDYSGIISSGISIEALIQSLVKDINFQKKSIVLMGDLSDLLLFYSQDQVIKIIRSITDLLSGHECRVICCIHGDTATEYFLSQIQYVFHAILDVRPEYQIVKKNLIDIKLSNNQNKDEQFLLKCADNNLQSFIIQSLIKKSSGKVYKETVQCRKESNQKWHVQEFVENQRVEADQSTDIFNGNVPFNLSLTDKQKSDRDNVNLPYMERQDPNLPVPEFPVIDYIPDAADDIDDEDPDFF